MTTQPTDRPRTHFPFFRWVARKLMGHWARRIYLALLSLFLLIATGTRVRAYFMVRKIDAVLRGLAKIRLDQTTEEQMTRMVPYLVRNDWNAGGSSWRNYRVHISNETDRWPRLIGVALAETRLEERFEPVAQWLGFRSIDFDAGVIVQDGKVSMVEYGLVGLYWPQYAGYMGYLVSATSVHAFWLPHPEELWVSSMEDYSPQYRPSREGRTLNVIYTSDAPPEVTKRVFDLNLSCFWSFRGCEDAADVAPEMSQDVQTIREATYQQLISRKCPDSIVAGRMRYLPDISVLLLEVTGSRDVEVNEGGDRTEDSFTDYKLKEVIRGQNPGSWKNVRWRPTILSPLDPQQRMANQIWLPTKVGSEVLYFGGAEFNSCRFIPATPSALKIVRTTPVPQKRPEDQVPRGLG